MKSPEIIEKWDLYQSYHYLLFKADCKHVKWQTNDGQIIPASPTVVASLPSFYSTLSVRVISLPKLSSPISFGIAFSGFPLFGTDLFGARTDSWGISDECNSVSEAVVSSNGVWRKYCTNIKKGDLLQIETDIESSYSKIIINGKLIQK